jgi:hypothetical protein
MTACRWDYIMCFVVSYIFTNWKYDQIKQMLVSYFILSVNNDHFFSAYISKLCLADKCFIHFRITCSCYIYLGSQELNLAWLKNWTPLLRFCNSNCLWVRRQFFLIKVSLSYFQKLVVSAFYTWALLFYFIFLLYFVYGNA